MDGILLIDKPKGWTSHDVVAKVRNILRDQAKSPELRAQSRNRKPVAHSSPLLARGPKVRVGHTGTLDPMATGLLVLVVGSYTKKAAEYSGLDKTYEAELTLGKTSSTGDSEGKITLKSDRRPSFGEVKEVLNTFLGQIIQTPPAYSAVKVGGQRAYKLTRQGKEVKLKPRKVKIHWIRSVKYKYSHLRFTAKVSSGTYIRSLAEDIGQKLGTGAYLSALRRTSVGRFSIDQAAKPENLPERLTLLALDGEIC